MLCAEQASGGEESGAPQTSKNSAEPMGVSLALHPASPVYRCRLCGMVGAFHAEPELLLRHSAKL